LRPTSPAAHYNLGMAFLERGRPGAAEAPFRDALRLRPDYAEAWFHLGQALRSLGRPDEAKACFRQLVGLPCPEPEAHLSRALAWLLLGDYERGWREYEWRWQCKEVCGGPALHRPRS